MASMGTPDISIFRGGGGGFVLLYRSYTTAQVIGRRSRYSSVPRVTKIKPFMHHEGEDNTGRPPQLEPVYCQSCCA